MRSGTHRDLKFWSKMRRNALKKNTDEGWDTETSKCDANNAVLHSQSDRSCLGPIETCFSGPYVAVLHPKTTRESWDPWRLVFLMLGTLI